ncbi:BTB/POZ domain-containing protein At1g67900 [Nicotiana tabacum]|uniref:BTB/POZ domain-containing protein At1g67900 n=1 Tax=Nicotiana tabacum TaxID=4097 RepID=A0A1S3XDU0_TOBAC|nr:BTB/POZ domain-containing protein At1g67900-like [Nicotiana tomentosiformis]XP_016438014.1 PREDICTED: BTB/POZ domain-containing protein At1g67900-like [Nicotiana tabacum]XP_033508479.1 BTB/POZ domain-containing protein At1g67900-like [Nicotiana tomentosiformis]
MKFMKLGSRPDTFFTTEAVRSVSSEILSDLIVQVKGSRYLLHKFPLLSKCLRLQRLCVDKTSQHQIVQLPDFPCGIEDFELCAKFCYGITITLSAHNIVSVRCAAEYLQMTEDVEKGNLICKLQVFLNSCVLSGWRDSIVTLQSTKAFPLWSEDLGITSTCIEAIASKVLAHPLKMNLSHSYSRRDDISCNGSQSLRHNKPLSKDWWADDLAELSIDLYWRTMIAIKSGVKVPAGLIGDALRIYASRWLPHISKYANLESKHSDSDSIGKYRLLLESIISLLPTERGAASCSFLLKLLKAANILKASSSSKMELVTRVGLQLEDATVGDLLIPCVSKTSDTIYDVDIVMTILEQFMLQGQSPPTSPPRMKGDFVRRRSRSAENIDLEFQESRRSSSASHSSKLKVAKLVDGYLQEIASEEKLPLSNFIFIAEAIPKFARLDHDDLYRAIDIYLKGHPGLNKNERKRLCRMLDCKKLSMEVCMHAAQNELLPLRVVVQVLFFEQARATMSGGHITELPSHIKALLANHDDISKTSASFKMTPADDQWSASGKLSTLKNEDLDENYVDGNGTSSRIKASCIFPSRPKRMFSKLWSSNRSVASEKN